MTLSELQKAGFTTEEIGRYAREKRQKLLEAGFTPDEINSNFYGRESVETLTVEQPAGKPPWWERLIMAGAPEPPPASIDEMMTAVMPDKFKNDPATYSEEVAKSLNPLVRPFVAQGFNAMSGLNRGFATFATHLDSISTYVSEKTGMEKAGILGPDALKKVADYYNKDADHWAKRAQEVGINFIDELISEAVGGAMPGIAEFMLNIPYSALLGASEAYRKGESEIVGALVEGAKRGVLGAMFHAIAPLKKYLQAPLMGGVFGVQAAGEGATPREIAKSVGTGALYALTSPGGRLGLNDLQKDLIKNYVRVEAEKVRIEPDIDVTVSPGPAIDIPKDTKVIDPSGQPMIMYHASDKPVEFKETGKEIKFYSRPLTQEFGPNVVKAYLDIKNPAPSFDEWRTHPEKYDGFFYPAEDYQGKPGYFAGVKSPKQVIPIKEPVPVDMIEADAVKIKESLTKPMNVRERDALGLTENQARLLEKIQGEDPQRYATIMKDFTEAQRTNWEAVRKALSEEPESVSIERMTRKTGAGEIPTKETPMPVGGKDFTDQQILERFENEFRTDPGHLLVTEKNISKIKEIAAILKEKIDKSIIRPDEYFALRGSYFIPRKKFRKSSESVDDIRIGSLSGTSAVELSPNATVGEIETAIKHATAYGDKIFLLKASGEPLRGNDFWADEIILPEHQIEGIHFNLKDVVKEFDLIRKYYKAELAAKAYPKTKDPHFTLDYYSITSEKNAPVIYKFKDGSEIPIPEDVFNDLGKEKAREQILLMQIRKAIAENKQIPDELLLWADLPKPSPPSTEGGGISIPPTKATLPMAREGEEWRRAPEGEKAGPPMSRADILRFLQEKLDIPIRTGRFIERALAVFKPSERVIRSQKFADIEAIAHEVGHSIQEFLWPETVQGLTPTEKLDKYQAPPLTRDKPFLPFRDELIDLASMARPGQSRLAEGYAEFVRLYMTNEPMASGLAPKFYEYFDHLLEQRAPESREVFFQVREMYNQYMRQPAYQRVRSQVSIGENIPRKTTLDDLYTLALDEFHPLKRTQKEILQGEKIPLGDRPYERARLLNGWMGKANSFLRHAAFRFNTLEDIGKSFQDILKPIAAENNLEELSTYLVAKRVPGLADRGIDVGIGVEDAKKVVADLDVKYSKVFADLEIYQENLLKYLVESGILSDDAYKKISTVSKDYDPFYRVFEERTGPGGGMGKGLQAYQPIKEIKGGWQRIQDPLESIIKNTMLYINLSERNAVGKSLVTLAQSHEGMGKFVEEIPVPMYGLEVGAKEIFSPQEAEQLKKAGLEPQEFYTIFRPNAFTPRENVISVWIAGERKDYQVEPDVYRTFRALDREGANALERLAAYPARWLRAGSVLTPEFLARNPFRDQFSAFIQSKYNFIPGLDLIRGVFHLMKQDETYWKWQKSGGTQATLASMDRDYFQEKMGEILKGYPILKLIKNPIEGLRVLGELGEIGTRLGEFAKGLKAEGETKGGIEAAGFSSREVTTDFQRFGAKTRGVNLIIAFWNANMQAMDRTVRAFQENPAAATIKAMAAITLPSVLLAWANHDDPRYWEIPQWQRDLCWIVFPNHMSKESWEAMSDEEKSAEVRLVTGAAWRFPKPWEIGILFGSIPERITHYILKNDPEAFSKIGESIFRTIIPPILPNIAIPWIENLTNYSFFFDRNIVPGDRKDLPPEFQYGPWTTPAAKALGETLGRLPYIDKTQFASPAKVENLIRGWTGGLGYYALQIASAGLQYTGAIEEGPPKPTKSFADIPLIKAFAVRYPSTSAESIQEFYERYKEAAGIARAIEVTAREYRFDKSIKLLVEDYAGNLEGHHQTMSNLQKMVELVYNNPDMTPDEKREFVDICYFQMIDVAHNGVQMIKELKKILKENRKEPQRPAEPIKPRKPAPLKTPRSVEFEGR